MSTPATSTRGPPRDAPTAAFPPPERPHRVRRRAGGRRQEQRQIEAGPEARRGRRAHGAMITAYPGDVPIVIRDGVPLAPLTTLELGGPARHLCEATDDDAIVEALRWAEARKLPAAILGGGSNLVVGDAGFDGLCVRVATRGIRFDAAGGEVHSPPRPASPGTRWWPRRSGAAWGGSSASRASRGWSARRRSRTSAPTARRSPRRSAPCACSSAGTWRTRELARGGLRVRLPRQRVQARSRALRGAGGHLRRSARAPRRRCAIASSPSAWPAARVPTLADARAAVLALRARQVDVGRWRGDPNRRSAGSFFTNPIVSAGRPTARRARAPGIGDGGRMPRWPAGDGRVKLSAGWLIERAGIGRGLRRGTVGVSSAHALALVHHGGGTTAALLALAREVAEAVQVALRRGAGPRADFSRDGDGLEPGGRLSIQTGGPRRGRLTAGPRKWNLFKV